MIFHVHDILDSKLCRLHTDNIDPAKALLVKHIMTAIF